MRLGVFLSSLSTLQVLAVKSLSILKHLVAEQPEDFGELLFLQSDILPFLRLCANQAPYDKKHISRVPLSLCSLF